MGVRVEIRVPQEYPSYCIALLKALFANLDLVEITKHFTEGQSGTFVFLVESTRPNGETQLPVVVKIGPNHLLEQELRAAQAHIENRLPGFVPISGELASTVVTTEDGSTATYSAARYQLAGHGVFAIETLRDYALTAPVAALRTVIEEYLFRQLDRIWNTPDPPVQRRLRASYDRVLPVNLLLEFVGTSPLPPLQIDALGDPASYPQLQPGDWVQLKNFVITEIDATERSLTLNLPQPQELRTDAYRLRIRNIANLEQHQLDETVVSLTGRVVKTRQLFLQEAVRDALSATVDLTQPLLHLPETDQQVPNPLLRWPALLQEQMAMRIGTVHGDLNVGNVLVEVGPKTVGPKTTFLIDCAHAHRDHVLYDLVRLESEVLLHMAATHFYNHQPQLPPTTIHDLYNWLDFVTRRDPDETGFYSVPQPLLQTMPELQTAFIVLTTIRNHARQYLAVRGQWREYYVALTLTLLGSLKFSSLDDATPGREPKAVAFWGAATLLARLEEPAQLRHIGWQRVAVEDAADAQQQASGSTQPQVYIDYRDQHNRTEPPPAQRRVKLLFLTANPLDTGRARTDEEAHAIDQMLRQAEYRVFDFHPHQAVRIDDLQELLLRYQPDIVHFSGHGASTSKLVLQDANGNATPVNGPALRSLFDVLKDKIRCVVLNACYTEDQARSLAEVIDCVIGISNTLPDKASIQFATAFYRALGYGHSVEKAFSLGRNQVELSGSGEGEALRLYGFAAAQTSFVEKRPADTRAQKPDDGAPGIDTPINPIIFIARLLFNGAKTWFSDFFRLHEADEGAKANWASMTLYLLRAVMKRVSGEGLLSFLLTAFTAAFAIWSITPLLAWPQTDEQERLYAALRFGVAALFLPVLIALLIKPDGEEKFPLHETRTQWRLLVLKLAGAWTGFGALAGTALIAVILWYHLFGGSMPVMGQWLLALLPPFFAYVSARRIPSDRYKMFGGELRLHAADRLFFAVFALFGPGLAAVVYWGHWFLINQGVMLSVLLGSIGLIVWEIHRHDKRRFPDLLVIVILGLLLPLGFLLLFFFDMYPLAPAPTLGTGEAGIFAALAAYVLSTTLLLATVAVRQQTILTIPGMLGLSALLVFILMLLRVNLWFGGAIGIGLLLLWYLWGRSRVTRWHQVHPSVDLLGLVIIGAALLGVLTPVPLWGNAMLFALFAGVLVLWAYQKNDPATPDQMGQRPAQNSSLKRWGILLFIIVAIVGLAVVVANTLIGDSLSTTPAQDAANTPAAIATGTATVQPAVLPTTAATATSTATTTPARLTVARSAPGANRYFIAGPSLADYQLGQLLAVYAQASAGQEFDVAVVLVVDKNIDNLVVQVIFQNEDYPLDSLAALQLDDQLGDVDLASMAPVNDSYVGFMLADATIRLASAAPVKVGDQLEAVQLTQSGDTLRFPAGRIMIHIDSIGTDRKIAGVSAPTSLPSLGTLLVLAPESATSTSTPAPSPTSIATPTAANTPAPQPQSDVPIYESFDSVIKLDWKNARGEWGVSNQRLQVRRFEGGLAAILIAHPQWPRYAVQMNFGTLKHLDDSGNVNVPFSNFHVLIHFQGTTDGYWFTVANGGVACTIYQNDRGTRLTPSTNQWNEMFDLLTRRYTGDHELEITVRDNRYAFTLNGETICSFQDDTYPEGSLGVVVSEGASGRMWIDNVRIVPLD
jgi:hypothetical protein